MDEAKIAANIRAGDRYISVLTEGSIEDLLLLFGATGCSLLAEKGITMDTLVSVIKVYSQNWGNRTVTLDIRDPVVERMWKTFENGPDRDEKK